MCTSVTSGTRTMVHTGSLSHAGAPLPKGRLSAVQKKPRYPVELANEGALFHALVQICRLNRGRNRGHVRLQRSCGRTCRESHGERLTLT